MPCLPSSAAQCTSLVAWFQSERRACFSVGVGCPSFGGQRADRGGSTRLRANVVTGLKPQQPAERAGGLALRSQPEASSRVAVLCEGHCPVKVLESGQPMGENRISGWPNLKCRMPEVSTRQRRASWLSSQAPSPVVISRSGHLVAQAGLPNPSVKGTSRKRAAPYVER